MLLPQCQSCEVVVDLVVEMSEAVHQRSRHLVAIARSVPVVACGDDGPARACVIAKLAVEPHQLVRGGLRGLRGAIDFVEERDALAVGRQAAGLFPRG